LTVLGLWLTYKQAKKATSAAQAAELAVNAFQIKLDRYSAYKDVVEAMHAMDAAGKFVKLESWADASEYYENSRRALVRLKQSQVDLDTGLQDGILQICSHMSAFSNRVDTARSGKGTFPNKTKVLSSIRENYGLLTSVKMNLEKEVVQ